PRRRRGQRIALPGPGPSRRVAARRESPTDAVRWPARRRAEGRAAQPPRERGRTGEARSLAYRRRFLVVALVFRRRLPDDACAEGPARGRAVAGGGHDRTGER